MENGGGSFGHPRAEAHHAGISGADVAAATGAGVMILEVMGVRVMAPWFGQSQLVWTHVIGVVLAVLSMQFLSSGLNMLQVSNFARELIWGALLIFVMVLNTGGLRLLRPKSAS